MWRNGSSYLGCIVLQIPRHKTWLYVNSQFLNDVLEIKLTYLTRAPMKPQERIYALRTHLIPSLWYPFIFVSTGRKDLQ